VWACVVRPHAVEITDRYREMRISGTDPLQTIRRQRSSQSLNDATQLSHKLHCAVRAEEDTGAA